MPVVCRTGRLEDGEPDAVALPVGRRGGQPELLAGADAAARLGVDAAGVLARQESKGEAGEVLAVPLGGAGGPEVLLLLGVGDGAPGDWRKAGAALGRRCRDSALAAVPLDLPGDALDEPALTAFAEGAVLGAYRYRAPGAAPKGSTLRQVELVTEDPRRWRDALRRAEAGARATLLARDLTNTPALVKSPQWLAQEAERCGRAAGLDVLVRDEQTLAAEGFGGVLAVGAGSARPPCLIEMRYAPRGATRHVVLVGKGITFDSGGLSLKPNESMTSMKTDMAGGAAVIGAMAELAGRGVRARVTGLVPAAENLPSGSAQRPGDVIRHYGGRTSEVLNTDAEGRLVLADALAYADAVLRPDVLVDLATLTGAASLGLGKRHGALYASTDALAAELATAAARAGEKLWRMPLVQEYRFAIDSRIADVANTATSPDISAGSILAALFLREFTGGRPWAHLDIAGPARSENEEDEVGKGATGYGARLLLRWLEEEG